MLLRSEMWSSLSYGQRWRRQDCGQVQCDRKNAFKNRNRKLGQRRSAACKGRPS